MWEWCNNQVSSCTYHVQIGSSGLATAFVNIKNELPRKHERQCCCFVVIYINRGRGGVMLYWVGDWVAYICKSCQVEETSRREERISYARALNMETHAL
jgi:hypothetical protein